MRKTNNKIVVVERLKFNLVCGEILCLLLITFCGVVEGKLNIISWKHTKLLLKTKKFCLFE